MHILYDTITEIRQGPVGAASDVACVEGAAGARGERGDSGAPGPAGPAGDKGARGKRGKRVRRTRIAWHGIDISLHATSDSLQPISSLSFA